MFAQHLRRYRTDAFMLFAGAPIDQHRSRSFNVVGVQKRGDGNAEHRAVDTTLRELCGLSTTCSPRTSRYSIQCASARACRLARYLNYVSELPRGAPPLE
jgi:hypothetical protein